MCGIAGVIYAERDRPVNPSVLQAMSDQIAHRGPDSEGFLIEPGIGLAHRRLSIIDIAGGQQPLGNETGSVQTVFNGEIYNFQNLRRELLALGHRFQTQSDTEILVHLYEEIGERLVDRLRGMFAFALWDKTRRRLLLARDRIGIKPLYIYRDTEKLIFGSEIKAILAHPDVSREIDPEALEGFLALGIVSGARSIFHKIEKLQPAHILSVTTDQLWCSPQRYWQLTMEPDERPSVGEWCEEIRAKIIETTRMHLTADVPVGAFLSGGVDSSLIVAVASDQTRGKLQTFSLGFEDEQFSELAYAKEIANRFNTDHTESIVTSDSVSLLDELTHYYDEPFADPSAIPSYLVSRLASQHVKVVLSGDGGDEAFGGYDRYAHDLIESRIRKQIPRWLRQSILAPVSRVWPKSDWLPRPLRARTLLTNLSLDPGPAYANTLMLFRQPFRRRLIESSLRDQLQGHNPCALIEQYVRHTTTGDILGGMISADTSILLPDAFLVKVDRASMAHGLEVRPPLVDHELMELAARIPSKWKIHKSRTKWILKQAFKETLPVNIRDRPKRGFEIPIDDWLRGPLRPMFEAAVLEPNARVRELVDQAVIKKLYQAHLSKKQRLGNVLWSLLILAKWSNRYLGPTSVVPA